MRERYRDLRLLKDGESSALARAEWLVGLYH